MPVPDPNIPYPIEQFPRTAFLRPLITSPLIDVGEYTYYDDPNNVEEFQTRNVLYHFGPERLVIGKYCALATNVRFVMSGANHRRDGVTTYPFPIFGEDWGRHMDLVLDSPNAGDTVVGNDVWIGREAMIMPGVQIGSGSIIASGSVVTKDVAPYSIVGGNPAQQIRMRFSEDEVAQLLEVAWWDWPLNHITANIETIMTGSPEELTAIAP